jgi:hypothetical protein
MYIYYCLFASDANKGNILQHDALLGDILRHTWSDMIQDRVRFLNECDKTN